MASNPLGGLNVVDKQISRTALAETTSLTGLSTQSDAWGKVIPLTFGRTRVPGVLVWASEFYKTTDGFDTTTKFIDKYYTNILALPQNGGSGPSAVTETSQTTRETVTTSYIDLCYSFGKDGDTRRKRYVDIIRINETVVYDSKSGYIAPNLGFNIRYGYDNNIDPLMAKYANGDLFYKDQTLLIFNRFPLADYGDAVPKSIDVEFGCVPGEVDLYPCLDSGCGYSMDLDRHVTRASGFDRIAKGEVQWSACHIIALTVAIHNDFTNNSGQGNNNIVLPDTIDGRIITFGEGFVKTVYKRITEAEARDYNQNGVQLVTDYNTVGANLMTGRVRVFQIPAGLAVSSSIWQDPAEDVYNPKTFTGPCLLFRDAFIYALMDGTHPGVVSSPDPVINEASAHIQTTSHTTAISDNSDKTDGGVITCPGRTYFAVNVMRFGFTACTDTL